MRDPLQCAFLLTIQVFLGTFLAPNYVSQPLPNWSTREVCITVFVLCEWYSWCHPSSLKCLLCMQTIPVAWSTPLGCCRSWCQCCHWSPEQCSNERSQVLRNPALAFSVGNSWQSFLELFLVPMASTNCWHKALFAPSLPLETCLPSLSPLMCNEIWPFFLGGGVTVCACQY